MHRTHACLLSCACLFTIVALNIYLLTRQWTKLFGWAKGMYILLSCSPIGALVSIVLLSVGVGHIGTVSTHAAMIASAPSKHDLASTPTPEQPTGPTANK